MQKGEPFGSVLVLPLAVQLGKQKAPHGQRRELPEVTGEGKSGSMASDFLAVVLLPDLVRLAEGGLCEVVKKSQMPWVWMEPHTRNATEAEAEGL